MTKKAYSPTELAEFARNIRRSIIEMLHAAGSGHPGGALGLTDILTSLYFNELNIDPQRPNWSERDRFVLSPAHMVPGLYATLAERGFCSKSELITLRKANSRLKGHTFRDLTLGVETTGGSLAQGLSLAIGMALAARLNEQNGKPGYRTYCVISDGELNEGQTWEALTFAAAHKLDNLLVILDRNGIQLSDNTPNVLNTEPIKEKLEAFNWNVMEIDGHDFAQINFALSKARLIKGQATILLAHTVAGKGVSYMENNPKWHGKAPNDDEFAQAMQDLNSI